jgi:hypothetical protein
MKRVTLVILFLFPSFSIFAEDLFVLDGYKIGQLISVVTKNLKEAVEIHKFNDGFISYAFKRKDHYLIFETDPSNKDAIWSIQIQGKSNPEFCGLNGINLGDDESKIVKAFGNPDKKTKAVDSVSKKEVPDTVFYAYDSAGNYSFEVSKNKVTSIKILFTSPKKEPGAPSLVRFSKMCKEKDFYGLAGTFSEDAYISRNGKYHQITSSIVETITNDREYQEILFDGKFGIANLEKNDIKEGALRVFSNGEKFPTGYVFKVEKNSVIYEIVFVQSFEGWVIWEINYL